MGPRKIVKKNHTKKKNIVFIYLVLNSATCCVYWTTLKMFCQFIPFTFHLLHLGLSSLWSIPHQIETRNGGGGGGKGFDLYTLRASPQSRSVLHRSSTCSGRRIPSVINIHKNINFIPNNSAAKLCWWNEITADDCSWVLEWNICSI